MIYVAGLLKKVYKSSTSLLSRAMMINSTIRLGKNKRKNYEWSEIGLLDQSRYNERKCLGAGWASICNEKVTIVYANFLFPSFQLGAKEPLWLLGARMSDVSLCTKSYLSIIYTVSKSRC